jgi:hypothetical protein
MRFDDAASPLALDRRGLIGAAGLGAVGSLLTGMFGAPAAAGQPQPFHFVRIYEGPDQRSHIEVIDPRQAEEKLPCLYRAKAVSVGLLTFPAGTIWDWHLTHDNVRRLIVLARGLTVTIVDEGDVAGVSYYPWKPGTVMLAEDGSGRGHKGRVFADEDALVFQVDLASDAA